MSKINLDNQTFDVEIIDITVDGQGVAKHDEIVFFVKHAIPGDIVRIQVTSKKRQYFKAQITEILKPSKNRVKPLCKHFGLCGGCKWQNMSYDVQLHFKQKQVYEQLERIGKLQILHKEPILGCNEIFFYRNKLDFSFSTHKWFIHENDNSTTALGFHIPGRFDKVLDIEECFLQPEPSNKIRNDIRELALKEGMPFYDIKKHQGFLRNLIIRNNRKGEFMLILVVAYENNEWLQKIYNFIQNNFKEVKSLYLAINQKLNDSLDQIPLKLIFGQTSLNETLLDLKFEISPVSFFQTNLYQTEKLYSKVLDLANLKGNELIFDLFCGTGTISLLLAKKAKFVVGIEAVKEAVKDAYINAEKNQIKNVYFVDSDVKNVRFKKIIKTYGKPDLIVLDPPRSGVHPNVIKNLLDISPERIIYISCNAATQARDLSAMTNHYKILVSQPVDMFPHTSHVENIILLEKI